MKRDMRDMRDMRDIFDQISPLDHRYYKSNQDLMDKVSAFFSENAAVRYQLQVETALAQGLEEAGVCPIGTAAGIEKACAAIDPDDVYQEEEKTHHNIRALTNCIARRVSEHIRPYIHLTATSVDILDTANALRFRDAHQKLLRPMMLELERVLIDLARREKDTVQIGRTHGQHAVPITFGFAVAEYVARLSERITYLDHSAAQLKGKMAGAVGAYNAAALIFDDPDTFEKSVLARLELQPATHSTQIVAPEFLLDYLHGVVSAFGVLANLADDFRNLQRSEIAEISEAFSATQVGSSTMPHKRNPWNFEHVKSLWKSFTPRIMTVYMDQISEHQRDLTNSASGRFAPELVTGFILALDRTTRVLRKLTVDSEQMRDNAQQSSGRFVAEPLYICLAAAGHPGAHEIVRKMTLEADQSGRSLKEIAQQEPGLAKYLSAISERGSAALENPLDYLGIASQKTEAVCAYWEEQLFRKDD